MRHIPWRIPRRGQAIENASGRNSLYPEASTKGMKVNYAFILGQDFAEAGLVIFIHT